MKKTFNFYQLTLQGRLLSVVNCFYIKPYDSLPPKTGKIYILMYNQNPKIKDYAFAMIKVECTLKANAKQTDKNYNDEWRNRGQ